MSKLHRSSLLEKATHSWFFSFLFPQMLNNGLSFFVIRECGIFDEGG